jgi:hypothetical protein
MANPSDQDVAVADKLAMLPNANNVRRDAIAEAIADAYAAGCDDRMKGTAPTSPPAHVAVIGRRDYFRAAALAALVARKDSALEDDVADADDAADLMCALPPDRRVSGKGKRG